jgi:predicted N-acetyltransferase YhbS
MSPSIHIRTMAEGDLPAVLAIQSLCYTELTPESRESLRAKLCASPSTCLIAVLGAQPVGYLIALPWQFSSPPALNARTCRLPPAPDCLYLHDLAVMPSARSTGAGRALVAAALRRLAPLGLERASLIAVQGSTPYWQRHGFRAVAPSAPLGDKLASYGSGVQYMERTTWLEATSPAGAPSSAGSPGSGDAPAWAPSLRARCRHACRR